MKPIDLRDATFESLREGLSELRQAVYAAYLAHGPCTTRELSGKCGIDILTLRPRTTELVQIGLVELVSAKHLEGSYRGVGAEEWSAWHREHVNGQQPLI